MRKKILKIDALLYTFCKLKYAYLSLLESTYIYKKLTETLYNIKHSLITCMYMYVRYISF